MSEEKQNQTTDRDENQSCHCGCGEYNCQCDGEHECGCGEHDCQCNGEHSCGCGDHECGCGGKGTAPESESTKEKGFNFESDIPLPKPTLVTFATSLAQQAMVSMGILPHPATGKSVFLMNQATFLIDTIELIIEKTEGNRTEEETKILTNMTHELRMLYIAAMNEKTRREQEQEKK